MQTCKFILKCLNICTTHINLNYIYYIISFKYIILIPLLYSANRNDKITIKEIFKLIKSCINKYIYNI